MEQFDHVQRGLVLDDDEDEDKKGVVRNATEDMKRALGALQVRGLCACLFSMWIECL